MANEITAQMEALKKLSLSELKETYQQHFQGKRAVSGNRVFLWRKIAHQMQVVAFGGLSLRAQEKLHALLTNYDPVNNTVLKPKTTYSGSAPKRDRRLPLPGTIITKEYKGTKIQVKALEKGFEYNGKLYKSLTAIAQDITGAHWNGYHFFNL